MVWSAKYILTHSDLLYFILGFVTGMGAINLGEWCTATNDVMVWSAKYI